MAGPGFVHLHVHSSFSLLESALTIERLAALAKADRQPALALTDTDNMFGVLEFSEKLAGYGIQPIVGCSLAVDFGDQEARVGVQPPPHPRIVLLAAREDGYRSLMRLNSRAFLETAPTEKPHIKLSWLDAETAGLIALSGGPGGPLDAAIDGGQNALTGTRFEALARLFGDRLYIELQRHHTAAQRANEGALIELAYARGVPLVATNAPLFATREDYEAHDALICIAEGRYLAESDRRQFTAEHRFKTRAEMTTLFSDLPEALASTVEIAQRCAFRPRTQSPILPRFSVGEQGAKVDEAAELRKRAEEGLERRVKIHGLAAGRTLEEYRDRLAFELKVIEGMKYPGYFLIVSDFIQWAKQEGIPVGPGRGSGAGSLVSYALTITDLDPMRFGLLFERFLNPERVSMPDFDIDFCQDRRDEVIRYVQERYGSEQVAQIITFGTLQARGVLRDVGRVCRCRTGRSTSSASWCRRMPSTRSSSARRSTTSRGCRRRAIAIRWCGAPSTSPASSKGLHRHASTHAAGIVIGERRLDEMVPLYRDPKSLMPVTQFNMKWVEQAGLVKFDFLGLKTLTVLQTAVALVKKRGIDIDLAAIPLDDEKTYALLARAEAVGIFQLESQGMRRALLEMKPDRFEDIIALVALYRPGPMANIPTYCARKHGLEEPEYIHPKLEPVLRETYGVIVYQEQVMQAAQMLSGYSLGEADLLRRAMGKKIRAEMQKQKSRFVTGCVEREIERSQAEAIFELLERFADYGFNKSHAAAYALVAYQTAYMKTNYPVEFLAASMTLDMGNTDKLSEFRAEAQRLGIKVEPPSINRSGVTFDVEGNTIYYALAALKGVGRQAVEAIVTARGSRPFADLSDFASRISPRALNKRVLESLAAAGAFEALEGNRAQVFAVVDSLLAVSQREHEAQESGALQFSFGGPAAREPIRLPAVDPWPPAERLQKEFDAIGFFLTGHPLDDYAAALRRMRVQSYAEFARAIRTGASAGRVAGTVVARTERRTRTGSKMGIIGLSDPSGHFEAVVFSEGLQQFRDLLEPGSAVLLTLSAELQGDDVRARIQNAEPLDQAAAKLSKGLRVFLRAATPLESVAKRLEGNSPGRAAPEKADGEVALVLMLSEGTEVEVKLPGRFKVSPQIAGAIKAVPGVVAVEAV